MYPVNDRSMQRKHPRCPGRSSALVLHAKTLACNALKDGSAKSHSGETLILAEIKDWMQGKLLVWLSLWLYQKTFFR